jgi:hypothetical protein
MDLIGRIVVVFLLNVLEDAVDLVAHRHREAKFRLFMAAHPGVTVYRLEDVRADTHARNPHPYD